MGFRSVFVGSDNFHRGWPVWFTEKWAGKINIPILNVPGATTPHYGCLSAKAEAKLYDLFETLAPDIQRVLQECCPDDSNADYILVWLHECDGITRCHITKTQIIWTEPNGWRNASEGGDHHYCYGCSDPPEIDMELRPKRYPSRN